MGWRGPAKRNRHGTNATTCTFCGVGCGIYLEAANDRVTGAYPSLSHPTNRGRICVRGWHVHEVASSPERLRSPLLRRGGRLVEATWDEALGYIVGRIKEIRARYGPDALAFFNMPRCSNEESYLLQKLARAVMGTNNVDHGSGPYCNNSINVRATCSASRQPPTRSATTCSDAIVVDGVDLGMQLPTIGGIVIRAKLDGPSIVIDPRRHCWPSMRTIFTGASGDGGVGLRGDGQGDCRPRPMNQSFVKTHCRDYDAFVAAVGRLDLLGAAEASGVAPELIEGAALAYGRARAAAWLYSTGVEARNEDSIRSAVNLVLLTGNVGRPGAGVYALTEHNNLQGVRHGGLAPMAAGLPMWPTPGAADVRQAWDTPPPPSPVWGARHVENGRARRSRRLATVCDPVTSAAQNNVADVLREWSGGRSISSGCGGGAGHVVLPVVAYGEEEVSFTSTDRRIRRSPGAALSDAHAGLAAVDVPGAEFGRRWAYGRARASWTISRVVPDYSGVSHENLGRDYGRQWSYRTVRSVRLIFFDTGIPGRCFRVRAVAPPAEVALQPAGYPFALIFGHSLYYWHQNVLVKHSETLRRELRVLLLDYPEGFVEISDEDAAALKIRDGGRIRLVAEKGTALTTARVAREVRSGTIYVPFFVREVARDLTGRARSGLGDLDEPVFVRLERVDSQ